MIIEIQIRDSELKVQFEPYIEDIGIGQWECHGRGNDVRPAVTWDEGFIDGLSIESYKSTKVYEFDFDKLSKRNQSLINKEVSRWCFNKDYRDLITELKEA